MCYAQGWVRNPRVQSNIADEDGHRPDFVFASYFAVVTTGHQHDRISGDGQEGAVATYDGPEAMAVDGGAAPEIPFLRPLLKHVLNSKTRKKQQEEVDSRFNAFSVQLSE